MTRSDRHPCQEKCATPRAGAHPAAGQLPTTSHKSKRHRQLGKVAAKNVADYKWPLCKRSISLEFASMSRNAFGDSQLRHDILPAAIGRDANANEFASVIRLEPVTD